MGNIKLDSKLLPFIVILVGTVFFFFNDPPHSICTTQIESYKKSLKGKIYAYKDQKNIIPPKIKRAVEDCRQGKSSGSCIEYFDLVNTMMVSQNQVELKCMPELYAEKDIQDTIKKFFIISSVLAWGDEVPKDSKTNWFSDSNVLVYCKVKRALEEQLPKEEYDSLVDSVLASFPFAKLSFDYTESSEEYQKNKAILKMEKTEVFNKSILSLRCERYI